MKSKWERYREKMSPSDGASLFDIIKSGIPTVPHSTHDARQAACRDCDRFFHPTGQCKECGCFMAIKSKLLDAKCPLGKWEE